MSDPSPYCGRLDPHQSHEWLGRDREWVPPRIIVRDCPGRPVIEGGNPAALTWPIATSYPGTEPDDLPCETCGQRVHLPHDPACAHGHVVCDGCEIAEVCDGCRAEVEREAADELVGSEQPC